MYVKKKNNLSLSSNTGSVLKAMLFQIDYATKYRLLNILETFWMVHNI